MLTIINAITFDLSTLDANAMTIFAIGFGVVIIALVCIYLFFQNLPKLLNIKIGGKKESTAQVAEQPKSNETKSNDEVYAAIAMAMHLHFEDMHDEESLILTMDINERLNTQWNTNVQYINN